MSALSQTAASVIFSANASIGPVLTAGAAIEKGQPAFLDPSTGTVKLIGAAVSGMGSAVHYGLAAYKAASGQPVQLVSRDPACILGATMSPGIPVQAHTTAGSVTQTQADLSSGNTGVLIGVPTSSTVINLSVAIGAALS